MIEPITKIPITQHLLKTLVKFCGERKVCESLEDIKWAIDEALEVTKHEMHEEMKGKMIEAINNLEPEDHD